VVEHPGENIDLKSDGEKTIVDLFQYIDEKLTGPEREFSSVSE
jgi:hypothetical protein